MPAASVLSTVYLQQWQGIRGLTYDLLAVLTPADLSQRLPFPESQDLLYQFYCMLGASESYLRELQAGSWQGFKCSLDRLSDYSLEAIARQMREVDRALAAVLATTDLEARLENGKRGYEVVQRMVEHEMHHQGQLIHYIYCHQLPIPQSWFEKWHLTRGD